MVSFLFHSWLPWGKCMICVLNYWFQDQRFAMWTLFPFYFSHHSFKIPFILHINLWQLAALSRFYFRPKSRRCILLFLHPHIYPQIFSILIIYAGVSNFMPTTPLDGTHNIKREIEILIFLPMCMYLNSDILRFGFHVGSHSFF